MLAKRLLNANKNLIGKTKEPDAIEDVTDDGTFRENYIHLKDTGVIWSSTVLAPRLRQPTSNRP